MKLKVNFQKFKEKNTIKALIIGLMLAVFSLVEIIMADADILYSAKVVDEFNQFESVDTNCKQIDANTFEIVKSKSYVIIPVKEKYNALNISIGDISDSNKISDMKVWYRRRKGGWESHNTVPVQINGGNETIFVKFPEVEAGNIKISFRGEMGERINIQSLSFLLRELFMSKIAVFKMILLLLVLTVLFGAVAYYILHHLDNKIMLFFGIILLGELFFVFNNYFTHNYYLAGYLYPDPDDSFMDYFNMLALLNNKNPYYLNASYPALCFVILKFFHNFLPLDIAILEKGKLLRSNYIAMLGFLILFVIALAFVVAIVKRFLNKEYRSIYAIIILLSGPLLFAIQRGNLLLIALLFLLVYVLLYDSDSKKERYIAYFALAIASSIKIYPALFGLMTLKKKRYKETAHLAVIGFLVFLIPFFAFSGFGSVREMLHGLQAANEELTCQGVGHNFSLTNLATIVSAFVGHTVTMHKMAAIIITIALVWIAYMAQKDWHSLFLLATACVWFPEFSFTYVLVFYLPAALILIKEKKECTVGDYFDVIMLALLQVPFALPYMKWIDKYLHIGRYFHYMSYSTLVPNIVIIILVLQIIFEVVNEKSKIKIGVKKPVVAVILLGCITISAVALINKKDTKEFDFEGKGTKKSPYEIQTAEDFVRLHELVNSGNSFKDTYFVQTEDIKFDGDTPYSPMGDRNKGTEFAGIYNGNGYSIDNYFVMTDNGAGLFGLLTGTAYNMQLTSCNIRGGITGGIAYEVGDEGKIINCSINGILFGYKVSGLAAYNNGLIENSAAFVAVDPPDNWTPIEFGIAESTYSQSTINCYSNLGEDSYIYDSVDAAALVKLNSHVNNNNAMIYRKYKLIDWDISDGYLRLVR